MDQESISLFALSSSRALGESVGRLLGIPLGAHTEKQFDDGEYKSRPAANVRGKDVFVIHALHGDPEQSPDEKLMRLLFFLGALADAAAARVTAVVSYLCYARQDRKVRPNDPVTSRYVARMFEAVGVSRVVALDVHNLAAFQNAFRLPTEHLEACSLFVDHFAAPLRDRDIVVVSPDAGGVKRAELFRQALSRALGRTVASAFVEKQRSDAGVGGESSVGQFAGRAAIIIDDMICTGTTIVHAAQVCRDLGAHPVYAAATHGVFAGDAADALADPALESIVVTNSIPLRKNIALAAPKLVVLDAATLFAAAIRDIHGGGSTDDFRG
ncbi:MAG: ribose-phosphate pyrophosphokinase [Rhodocyclales bacterium GWA2_65_20]|nr:MAG: ribose-phosphate pyrophosphokinase [Rhodocyclales bacterium GWA2_65_20]